MSETTMAAINNFLYCPVSHLRVSDAKHVTSDHLPVEKPTAGPSDQT